MEESKNHDLMLLGLKEVGWGKRMLGAFTQTLVSEVDCATLLLSRRPARAYEFFDPLRDDVFESIRGAMRSGSNAVRSGSNMVDSVPRRMMAGRSGRSSDDKTPGPELIPAEDTTPTPTNSEE